MSESTADQFCDAMLESRDDEVSARAAGAVAQALFNAAATTCAIEGVEPFEVPADRSLYSLGALCQLLQQPPSVVRAVMSKLGEKPVLALNDIGYWSGQSVVAANRYLQANEGAAN